MSVLVEIKGKVNFIDLIDKNLVYAGKDSAYRICPPSDKLKIVTFYNPLEIGRGVEVEKKRGKIFVKLFAASTSDDVDVFYEVIKRICKINNQDYFLREGEKYSISDIDDNLLPNEQVNNMASFDTLADIVRKSKEVVDIFGVRNPISIDSDLLQHLEYDFNKYERFISSIQYIYDYYAGTFLVTKKKEKIGFVMIETDENVVIPVEPKIVNVHAPKDLVVDEWYIGNQDGLIKYENFIKYYEDEDLYDANHIMINISEERFRELLEEYRDDMIELKSK